MWELGAACADAAVGGCKDVAIEPLMYALSGTLKYWRIIRYDDFRRFSIRESVFFCNLKYFY